ncbi:MAG: ABC transporter ATP-binding protein [Eubacteriales bacterium]
MKIKVLSRLMRYTKPYLPYFVLSLLCSALAVIFTLFTQVLVGQAVDNIIGAGEVNFSALPPILIKFTICVAGSAVMTWTSSYFNSIITSRTVRDLRVRVFAKLHHMPLSYIDTNSHGGIVNRVTNDIDLVSDGMLSAFTQFFTGAATIIGTLIFMLRANVRIGLVVIILTPLSLLVASVIARGSYKYFTAQSAAQAELLGYIGEQFENQTLIGALRANGRSAEDFGEINARLYKCGLSAQIYSALANPCTRFVNALVYAAVGILGSLTAVAGGITVGGVSMFLTYANQYTKPFNEISGIVTQLQSALASAQRVFELLDSPDEPSDAPDAVSLSPDAVCGDISVRGVDFSYTPDRPLIENMSLDAPRGSRIAIVGPTGCGKTTLINLFMRFYDVTGGSITVDGHDIRSLTRSSLRSLYGMVLQDTWLVAGTVRENIAYGRPDASLEEIEAAAKAAHAHSFIKRLPNGYDTLIGEGSGSLSSGQRQLLCIARVMLRPSPMLILDEATSSIDTLTEIKIQKAFAAMMEGRTSFVVAHRLSTIRDADLILVMREGHIIEQGNHARLMAQGGFYSSLYNSMSKAAL